MKVRTVFNGILDNRKHERQQRVERKVKGRKKKGF